eukprot:TRINITY_DN3559_c0_g2_i1.p1 TRINITY_DN3559_c0_g2~~TRINITY_DN3559_c0_g2_i1.p1  ORF type:complete len:360 (+),score=50.32 TRINITY_DN3559_c0_g2_i1:83-1162(+)
MVLGTWDIIKLILNVVYGLLTVVSLAQVARILHHVRTYSHDKTTLSHRVLLQVLIFISVASRLTVMLIPFEIYNDYISNIIWLQIIMDMFPEIMFWSTFVVLIFLWAVMYHNSKFEQKSRSRTRMNLNWMLAAILLSAYLSCIAIAFIYNEMQVYKVLVEAIFLCVIAVIAVVFFAIYGYLLHRRLSTVNVQTQSKTKMLRRIKRVAIILITCNLLHAVFLILTDERITDDLDGKGTAAMWFMYFMISEATPALVLLVLFRNPPRAKIIPLHSIKYAPVPAITFGNNQHHQATPPSHNNNNSNSFNYNKTRDPTVVESPAVSRGSTVTRDSLNTDYNMDSTEYAHISPYSHSDPFVLRV